MIMLFTVLHFALCTALLLIVIENRLQDRMENAQWEFQQHYNANNSDRMVWIAHGRLQRTIKWIVRRMDKICYGKCSVGFIQWLMDDFGTNSAILQFK